MQCKTTFRDNAFHPQRLAERIEPTIDCFSCGHGYTCLGESPHPGVCERCGSRAVSPAGELTLTSQHDHPVNFDGTTTVVFDGHDDSGREFMFTVEVGDGTPRLRAVEIAGKRVTPDSPYWGPELRFDAVEQAVAEYVGDASARLLPVAQDGGR